MHKFTQAGAPALILILFAGAALRFLTLTRESLWYDELYVVWARKLPLGDMLEEIYASEHPPAFNVIGHFWNFLGHSDFWVRSLSALIGTATILLAYLLMRELASRRAGLLAAAFTAASPLLIWYSRDATSYAWVMAISLASLYLLVRCCNRGGWKNWTAYAIVTMVAVFSHLAAVVLLGAEAAFFFVYCRDLRARLKPWLAVQVILMPALVLMMLIGRNLGRALEVADLFAAETYSRFFRGITNAFFILLMGYTDQPGDSPAAVPNLGLNHLLFVLISIVAIAAPFAFRGVRRVFINRRNVALLVFVVIMAAGPIAFLLLRDTGAAGRYYAWTAAPILLLLASIVAAAPRRVTYAAGIIMTTGLLLTHAYDLGIMHNDDFRGVMAVVEEQRMSGDVIICYPQHNCVVAADFYLDGDMLVLGGFVDPATPERLYAGPENEQWPGYREGYLVDGEILGLEGADLEARILRETSGLKRFWLIEGDGTVNHLPSARMFETSLSGEWSVVESFDFSPLLIKLYEREG